MIAGETTSWWLIQPGMYVQDRTGGVWRIDGRRMAGTDEAPRLEFRMANRAGLIADVIVGHDEPVVVMVPTQEEAVALIARYLPVAGVQVRVIRMEEMYGTPDTKVHRRQIASHLLHDHGISISPTADAENDDIAGLLEIHAISHARPWEIRIPHVHVPIHEL